MPTYFLAVESLTADDGWRLLEWCLAHGGDEFTFDLVSLVAEGLDRRPVDPQSVSGPPERTRMFWTGQRQTEPQEPLCPFWRGTAVRECIRNGPSREVDLFELSESSINALREWSPVGIFEFWLCHMDSPPWLEDPAVYRKGQLLLGVISHEGFAEMRVTEDERESLAGQGIMLESVLS